MNELIEQFRSLLPEDVEIDDDEIVACLDYAKGMLLKRRYPFGYTDEELPREYDVLIVKLAIRRYYKRGAEGEISDIDSGVSRTYGSVNDEDILSEVTPIGKVY